jgi:Zn-dependent peptidase ImmA (M78 family)
MGVLRRPDFSPESFIEHAQTLVEAARVRSAPINLTRLAQLRGVDQIVLSPTLGVSGQLVWNGRALLIQLNSKESSERRNFTCCHEIAHTFRFDGSETKFRGVPREFNCAHDAIEERLCDRAASEMLLPARFFSPAASTLAPSIESLKSLAKRFGASLRATIRRIGETAAWPVVFIVWKQTSQARPGSDLGVAWSVRPAGSRCFIRRFAQAHPISGMYGTFRSGITTLESETLNLGSLRGRYIVENARFGEVVVSIVHDPRLQGGKHNAG